MYENRPVRKIFVKFWLSSDTTELRRSETARPSEFRFYLPSADEMKTITGSLNYEAKIYEEIIRPLIDFSICPHFIRFLGKGEGCKGTELINILMKSGQIERKDAIAQFARNYEYLYSHNEGRPSINEAVGPYDSFAPSNQVKKYACASCFNLLINEVIDTKRDMTFGDMLHQGKIDRKTVFTILFQILAALYAMSLTKTVHNDLHPWNIYVRKRTHERTTHYQYDHMEYLLSTDLFVRLYDFDRAYCDRMGNNPCLDEEMAEEYSQSNEFIPNRDAVKICCYVYKALQKENDKKDLLDALSESPTFTERVLGSSELDLKNPSTKKSMTAEDFRKHFSPIEDMLRNVAVLAGAVSPLTLDKLRDYLKSSEIRIPSYVCNRRMFDQTGRFLQRDKVHQIYTSMLSNMETALRGVQDAKAELETKLGAVRVTNESLEREKKQLAQDLSHCKRRMEELRVAISQKDKTIKELSHLKTIDNKRKRYDRDMDAIVGKKSRGPRPTEAQSVFAQNVFSLYD
jgi:hypothetical protein